MATAAHARRDRRRSEGPRAITPQADGAALDEDAEAQEHAERRQRAATLRDTRAGDPSDGPGGSDDGGSERLGDFARRGPVAPAAEIRALLDSGDLDRTLVLGGRVAGMLRDEHAATVRLDAKHAEIARLERTIGTRLVPDAQRAQDVTWDPQQPKAWLERYAGGEDAELTRARERLAQLRVEAADERGRLERSRPDVRAARDEALQRAQGEDLEVLLLATRRLRERGAEADAEAAERALTTAREEHARATATTERDVARLEAERDELRTALGHEGDGGRVAAHEATTERLRRELDEAAAPLAAVRGRMAELLMERDARTRRRDRRLYARSSAKDLLEAALARGRALRGSGGRAADTIAKRADGRTRELLAGGLSRSDALTGAPQAGLARRLLGGEGPERRRRSDPDTDGRSTRLPRRLRAQERRMARAYERAAAAYTRHVARSPEAGLLAELGAVEERLRGRRDALQRADAALLGHLTEVRGRLTAAADALPPSA